MKKITILLLLLSLVATVLTGCDGQDLLPPAGGDQKESLDGSTESGAAKPSDEKEDTNPSGDDGSDAVGPATIEYGLDFRVAESPDDTVYTCLGASDQTLAGRVAIQATYQGKFHVVSVWVNAFAYCSAITEVSIAEGILYINQGAFHNCTSLTDIYLPSSLTTIRDFAFAGCDNLTDIHFFGTRHDWQLIDLKEDWAPTGQSCVVHCTDGDIVIH